MLPKHAFFKKLFQEKDYIDSSRNSTEHNRRAIIINRWSGFIRTFLEGELYLRVSNQFLNSIKPINLKKL